MPERSDGRRSDKFWYDDPGVLFTKSRLYEFVPSRRMSSAEQLNAVVRFSMYLTFALLVFGGGSRLLFLPIVVAAGTYMFDRHGLEAPAKTVRMLRTMVGFGPDEEDGAAAVGIEEFASGCNANSSAEATAEEEEEDGEATQTFRHVDDGGFTETSPIGSNLVPSRAELPDDARRHGCQRPSRHNPFMNALVTDYGFRPRRPPACTRKQQSNIKQDVNRMFEKGLYQNVGEAWGTNNSQRQFFTMPYTTVVNNQGQFGQWLYQTLPILKEQGLIEQPRYAMSGL